MSWRDICFEIFSRSKNDKLIARCYTYVLVDCSLYIIINLIDGSKQCDWLIRIHDVIGEVGFLQQIQGCVEAFIGFENFKNVERRRSEEASDCDGFVAAADFFVHVAHNRQALSGLVVPGTLQEIEEKGIYF